MSLFITDLAFADEALVASAKLGILVASLLAGGIGFGLLLFGSSTHEEASQLEETLAAA